MKESEATLASYVNLGDSGFWNIPPTPIFQHFLACVCLCTDQNSKGTVVLGEIYIWFLCPFS